MRIAALALIGLLAGAPAGAEAPATSPRPPERPAAGEATRAATEVPRPQMSGGTSVAAASLVPLPRGNLATQGSAGASFLSLGPARPPPRPAEDAATDAARPALLASIGTAATPRVLPPPPRPDGRAAAAPPPPETAPGPTPEVTPAAPVLAVARSPRPDPRPAPGLRVTPGGVSLAAAFQTRPQRDLARPAPQGRLCGVRGIEGDTLAPIVARVNGCGIDDPVRVRSVEGVVLSTGAIMDCPTALALQSWVRDGVIPTIGDLGGGPASLTVGSHYACRTRNSQPGARLSEHGRGRAIDISAIVLADGSAITLLNGWGDVREGPILRALHRAACGIFGTVLGPNSDRFHRDHFHLDTARYRTGSFCR
jgi:hypothetical protein